MNDTQIDRVTLLEDLVIRSEGFRRLEAEMNYFCPFEAMGMTDQEIRHAHFLSYILDPHRPHGFEDAYLRAFLNVAAEKGLANHQSLRPIDIHLHDLSSARIVREKDRIDLKIEIPARRIGGRQGQPTVLIFELKINSEEKDNQLANYTRRMTEAHTGFNILFFYLTLRGDRPSENHTELWTSISLDDVISRFENVARQTIGLQEAQSSVRAYISMMRRKHLQNDESEVTRIVQELWATHPAALELLADNRPDEVSEIVEFLVAQSDKIAKGMSSVDLNFNIDTNLCTKNDIFLYVQPWIDNQLVASGAISKSLVSLQVSRYYSFKDKLSLRWVITPGDEERRSELNKALRGKRYALARGNQQIGDRIGLEISKLKSKGEIKSGEEIGKIIRAAVEATLNLIKEKISPPPAE